MKIVLVLLVVVATAFAAPGHTSKTKKVVKKEYVSYDKEYTFHGKYDEKNKCGHDGFYYRNQNSFVICSNNNAYVQPCADGTRNSAFDRYTYGSNYYYRDFCDINLVDYGYGARNHGYGDKSYGYDDKKSYGYDDDKSYGYDDKKSDYGTQTYSRKEYGYEKKDYNKKGNDRDYNRGYENRGYDQDYNRGYDKDYNRGYDKDYNRGYDKDYSRGYEQDYNRGYDKDYNRGYDQDYNRGYERDYGKHEASYERREYKDDRGYDRHGDDRYGYDRFDNDRYGYDRNQGRSYGYSSDNYGRRSNSNRGY